MPHLAGLALVLVALMPVIGTGASFSADEGAAIIQARSLSRGDGWIVDHPVPEADPAGRNYPLELSARGPAGVAPFAKHPLYAVVLAGADRIGGVAAMVLLSLIGTVAAGGVAGALARRLDPDLAWPAVWVTGVASPLLFDGYLVMAHALGAACAAAAVWLVLVAVERRRWTIAVVVGPVVALGVLLRTEAALFAGALALVLVLAALFRRHRAGGTVVLGVAASAALAGAGLARFGEAAWARHIVGGPVGSTGGGVDSEVGFLVGQVHALVLTWLQPGYGTRPSTVLIALVMMLAALTLGVFVARRHPTDSGALRMLSFAAAGSAMIALATGPDNLVPGLIVAFPVGLLGLLALDRRMFAWPLAERGALPLTATGRPQEAALLAAVFGLFAAAVIVTQYPTGGSSEWGGRYFAVGMPLLVPIALLALRRRAMALDADVARTAAKALAVCTLALTAMAVLSIRGTHRYTAGLMASVEKVSGSSGSPRPVIVTSEPVLPRLAWQTFDDQRWLLVEEGDEWSTVRRLQAGGSGPVTVVNPGEVVPDGSPVVARASFSQWRIVLVAPGTPA